jgi:hypothetical protein
VSFQPVPDVMDGERFVFGARRAERVGEAVSSEGIGRAEWVPLASVPGLVAAGDLWDGASLAGLMHLLAVERSEH